MTDVTDEPRRPGLVPDVDGVYPDLSTFLLARLDEDERVARDLDGARWTAAIDVGDEQNTAVVTTADPGKMQRSYEGVPMTSPGDVDVAACGTDWDDGDERAEHIARHDPARVLREVEAKRRIVRWVQNWPLRPHRPSSVDGLLEILALPYADHPDYRTEWRP